ncbi:MAG: 50S ribosome-binding GTPase [Thermoguttaceae bacterium]|nr:50S ribosome-binding GTPase [Thermoguttaceae bacterium]
MTANGENGKDGAFEVARLTAVGRGAVACVGVRGGDGWTAALERWRRSDGREGAAAFDDWSAASAERPYFGFFRLDEIGGASEEIVLRRRTPTAFEFCGHGGDVVASALVRFFAERGAAVVSGDAWERAVEREEAKLGKTGDLGKNGKSDKSGETGELGELGEVGERWSARVDELFFAGADALVVRTATETTARIALAQRGAWRRFLSELKAELRAASRLSDKNERKKAANDLTARFDAIAETFELGRRLTEPFVVLLTGIPNAGKSSFLNAALGFERVVVSPTSGTTRDLVGATTVLNGWTFRFVDAAGLRDAADPIERAGTRLTVEAVERADVVLRFFDATVGRAEQEAVFERFFGDRAAKFAGRTLDALNKVDLPRDRWASDWLEFGENWGDERNWEEKTSKINGGVGAKCGEGAICPISARTGVGVDALTKRIVDATVDDATRTNGPLLWSREQVEFWRETRDVCVRGDFETALRRVES